MIPFRHGHLGFLYTLALPIIAASTSSNGDDEQESPRTFSELRAMTARYVCASCGSPSRPGSDVRCRCGHVGATRRMRRQR